MRRNATPPGTSTCASGRAVPWPTTEYRAAAPVAAVMLVLASFVDEDQAPGIKADPGGSSSGRGAGRVGAILFAGVQAFFERDALAGEEAPYRTVARREPRAANSATTARKVRSGFSAIRASSHSRSLFSNTAPAAHLGRCCAAGRA